MTMSDKKGSDFRGMVVSMLTGFAGSKNVISIPHVFFKWTNRNHPLAIFFSQALYWHGKTDHPEKWFARTLEEWDEETGLGRAQLERAAVILEQVGLKREVKRSMWHGFVPVVHYRFDEDKLFEAARAFFEDGTTLSLKSTKESREKLKEDNALRAEKRKGHLNVTSKPDLNVTSKRQSNFTRKREMNAANDSYIKISRDQEETTEKITTTAHAIANAGPILNPDENDVRYPFVEERLSSLPINGKTENSAPAENRKRGKTKPTATTPPSPTPSPVPTAAVLVTDAIPDEPVEAKTTRKPNRMAQIIDTAWRKSVSGYLLPQLMGKADKPDRKPYNISPACSEAELWAFGNWWRRTMPRLNMPTKANAVYDAITGFRGEGDYARLIEDAEYDVGKMFPHREASTALQAPTPEIPMAAPEDIAAAFSNFDRLVDAFTRKDVS